MRLVPVRPRLWSVRIASLVAAFMMLSITTGSAHAAFPGRNGVIAAERWSEVEIDDDFSSFHRLDLVAIDPARRSYVQIALWEHWPAFSPDGRWLASCSSLGLVLRRVGQERRRVIPNTRECQSPDWSPGTTQLVFSLAGDLLTVNRNGRGRRLLVSGGSQPAWSSRGTISFVRDTGIYSTRPNGRRATRLTSKPGDSDPDWSPDGRHLVFERAPAGTASFIHVIKANGTGRRGLVEGHDPAWSPDGREIAFSRVVSCDFDPCFSELRVADLETRRVRRVAISPAISDEVSFEQADWQPLPR